jgi:NAD(P)-dependent dehydrogenase (short-subunit alcohol dehydrogenase family)
MTAGNHEGTMRFREKVVLVTGGSRGVGRAAADAFRREGAQVAIVARDAGRGQGAAAALGDALFIRTDVRSAADCARAVLGTLDRFERLDVLVNNAGVIYRNRTIDALAEAEWDETFDVNVKGAFLMSRAALPALRAARGTIVNVSSYAGLVGFAGSAAYAASKAALINLTRSLALDHAGEGIRVNAVCPGSVDTDMIHAAWNALPDPAAAARAWAAKHPLGRIATAEEVAAAILFLASEDARFITGVALPVDGGITAA